ncbi:TPA: beta-mannosidase [Serratia odorifera]|nr:beta-mannosidase [Serratia odorifera]
MANITNIAITTANSSADNTAQQIYQWLTELPTRSGKKLISGAFGGYSNIGGEDAFSLQQGNDIHNLTGKFPAIYAADYARGWDICPPGDEASLIDFSCNGTLIDHWKKGGLVAISHHLPNPVFAGNNPGTGEGALKHPISNDQFSQILLAGSPARQRWLAMLDKVAQGLQQLNALGITVLYRPLHEMNGEWFWWGASGQNSNDRVRIGLYQRLYRDMFSYFTNHKGLNNLLWIFSPDANRDYKTDYYPGDDCVDITGLDMYSDTPEHIAGYQEMLSLNKPFSFAEVGPATTNGQFDYGKLIATILQLYPKATLFIPWNNLWSPLKNINASAAYNNQHVINLGEVWNGSQLS